MFEDLQKNLEVEKNNFIKEFSKTESFGQLNFQINRIISFMTNMSDKTKTLAINSSIQASKAGEWYNNFSVVSKEVSELVSETSQATNRMQDLLFQIEDIFKLMPAIILIIMYLSYPEKFLHIMRELINLILIWKDKMIII